MSRMSLPSVSMLESMNTIDLGDDLLLINLESAEQHSSRLQCLMPRLAWLLGLAPLAATEADGSHDASRNDSQSIS